MAELWSQLDAWDKATFLDLNAWMHGIRGTGLRELLRLASALAGAWSGVLIVLGVLFTVRPLGRRLLWCCDTLVVYLVVGVAVEPLKGWIDRPRPFAALADAFADGRARLAFGEHGRYFACPSGHATMAFAAATLLTVWAASAGGRRRALAVGSCGLAWCVLVMLGRIYAGQHYPLDVLAGALLGIGITLLLIAIRTRARRWWRGRRASAARRTMPT